jgi:hypothetical protein
VTVGVTSISNLRQSTLLQSATLFSTIPEICSSIKVLDYNEPSCFSMAPVSEQFNLANLLSPEGTSAVNAACLHKHIVQVILYFRTSDWSDLLLMDDGLWVGIAYLNNLPVSSAECVKVHRWMDRKIPVAIEYFEGLLPLSAYNPELVTLTVPTAASFVLTTTLAMAAASSTAANTSTNSLSKAPAQGQCYQGQNDFQWQKYSPGPSQSTGMMDNLDRFIKVMLDNAEFDRSARLLQNNCIMDGCVL